MEPASDPYEDLNCPVCLQISRSAVESECCAHAFCEECIVLVKNKQNQCPCCKHSPLSFRQSKLIRRMISGIRVKCPNQACQSRVTNQDLPNHLAYCLFSRDTCRICKQTLIRRELIMHTLQKHSDQARKAIIQYQNAPSLSKVSSVSTNYSAIGSSIKNRSRIEEDLIQERNKVGRRVLIGTTGKYYCQDSLGIKCECCDGNCGPTNGDNCIDCMELDIKMRNLPKGYLLNSEGSICKVDLKSETVCCGKLTNQLSKTKCSQFSNCIHCFYLSKTLKRYEKLLI